MSTTITLTNVEKHALIEAASVFDEHGIEIKFPWECDLGDREAELYVALVLACRAYVQTLRGRR